MLHRDILLPGCGAKRGVVSLPVFPALTRWAEFLRRFAPELVWLFCDESQLRWCNLIVITTKKLLKTLDQTACNLLDSCLLGDPETPVREVSGRLRKFHGSTR